MGNPQKAKRTSSGQLVKPACKCEGCDAGNCSHAIKIKKHDCLHKTEVNLSHEILIRKNSKTSTTSNRSNCSSCSKPGRRKTNKEEPSDGNMMGLLEGLKKEGCCCEVVARAIADNPRRLGLAPLRDSINEGRETQPPAHNFDPPQ